MSLINEALKKAQRSRGDSPDGAGVAVGEVLVAKRRPPTSAKMILLYAAGGLVAFVLCVVGAVYYLNRPAPRPPAPTPTPAPRPVAKAEPAAPPVVNVPAPAAPVAPVVSPVAPGAMAAQPATTATTAATATTQGTQGTQGTAPVALTKPEVAVPAVSESKPAPASPADTPARPADPVTPPADAIANAPATAAPKPAIAAKADERVQVYLETLRITAVRALGSGDSRVMMNDRVYRVNDIVERNLGLRLTKVEAGQLTFTDANGVAYVKYF